MQLRRMREDGRKDQKDRTPALLLVEKDDGVRRFLFWALYVEGYKVLTARDGPDALRLSRDVPGPVEVLLMGSLPAGGDRATLRAQLEAERPELQTLDIAHAPSLDAPSTRIGKLGASLPSSTDAEALIERLEALLDGRPKTR
jgi:DNA-binding response OmpR family regulator